MSKLLRLWVEKLATESRSSIPTASKNTGIECNTGAAASVTAHRFVRKSVRELTTALSGRVTSVRVVLTVVNDALFFLIKTVGVLESVTDRGTTDEQVKYLDHKDALDLARVNSARIRVEGLASLDKSSLTTAGTGDIEDLPWHAGIVSCGVNDIQHSAVVTHR